MLAGSIALIGFGIDSAIEGLASVIIIWRFTGTRIFSQAAEGRAETRRRPVLHPRAERLADQLGSAATKGEGRQNMLCADLAGALLLGLLGNALFGAWWLDPAVGLLIAAVAVKEGIAGGARDARARAQTGSSSASGSQLPQDAANTSSATIIPGRWPATSRTSAPATPPAIAENTT